MPSDEGLSGGIDHDQIARLCTDAYIHSLPARGAKPAKRSNGVLEWTVLAGVVLSYPDSDDRKYSLVSLATGLKCVPYVQVKQSHGDVVHDSHAEVLARRGARIWLLARLERERVAKNDGPALFHTTSNGRSKLNKNVNLHLYVSTLPCGDASTLLFAFQRAQQDVDAKLAGAISPSQLLGKHAAHMDDTGAVAGSTIARGRAAGFMSDTVARGQLRTKPGRPDSPASISMSCSDKLALWNAVGIQGSMLSALLHVVRFCSLTVSDGALTTIKFDHTDEFAHSPAVQLQHLLQSDCSRSLNRAVSAVEEHVVVQFTAVQFADSKENVERKARDLNTEVASAPGSVLYVAPCSLPALDGDRPLALENLVAGTRLGASTKRNVSPPHLLKPAAQSSVSKLAWWNRIAPYSSSIAHAVSYWHAKRRSDQGTQLYRLHKVSLIGHSSERAKSDAVEAFLANFDTSTTPTADRQGVSSAGPAQDLPRFAGWLASPTQLEQFHLDGSMPN